MVSHVVRTVRLHGESRRWDGSSTWCVTSFGPLVCVVSHVVKKRVRECMLSRVASTLRKRIQHAHVHAHSMYADMYNMF